MSTITVSTNQSNTSSAPHTQSATATTWLAVVGACLGAFLAILNIQIVGSSLADVSGAIGAGLDEGNWITTSYLIAEIIVIPMSGWLTLSALLGERCDRLGRAEGSKPIGSAWP